MKLNISDELENTYHYLMKSAPSQLQNDPDFQKAALAYLKFGGATLARHYIEKSNTIFPDSSMLFENTATVETPADPDDSQENESQNNESPDENDR
jgi:hypothetical protein